MEDPDLDGRPDVGDETLLDLSKYPADPDPGAATYAPGRDGEPSFELSRSGSSGGHDGVGGGEGNSPSHRPPGGDGRSPLSKRRAGTAMVRLLLGLAALAPLVALVLVTVALFHQADPVLSFNGLGFFSHVAWRPGNFYANPVSTGGVSHPPGASYGALPLILGTLESSAIALVLAVPISLGTALVVAYKLPPAIARSVNVVLEVLAGVPSVVIGLWGALTFGPFLARDLYPWISRHVPDVSFLTFFRGPTGAGEGLLTSGIVLGVMIIPIIGATTGVLLRQVPVEPIEGAVALGMTDSEAVRAVSLRWVRSGVIGAAILGLGRALGETMAVAMVSGTVLGAVPHSIYQTITTIAATIVSQLDSALTDASGFALATLAEVGLVLVGITLLVNVAARWLVSRVAGTAVPVGRGI
jgi:phosphate transport system permease protein